RRITNVELRRLKAASLLGPAPRRSALRANRRVACAERERREIKEVNFKSFFAELKRRNVYKLAIAYVVVSWLLIQAASIFLPAFDAPGMGDEDFYHHHHLRLSGDADFFVGV